jgi:hypothetical protein
MDTPAMLKLKTTVLTIQVDPNLAARGRLHLGDAEAVNFVATAPCTLQFRRDPVFGSVKELKLKKGPNGPFRVQVEKGRCECSVKDKAAGPQDIIVP